MFFNVFFVHDQLGNLVFAGYGVKFEIHQVVLGLESEEYLAGHHQSADPMVCHADLVLHRIERRSDVTSD